MLNKYVVVLTVILSQATLAQIKHKDKQSNRPPNVLFILADDLGYGDLSCFGSDSIHTPNLDRLAREGVKLTAHYGPHPVCTPNRAALLTGQYPERCNMTHIEASWVNKGLPAETYTMGRMFKSKNYQTALIGKWHLGHKNGSLPNQHGFDYFFGLHFSNDQNISLAESNYRPKPGEELALMQNTTVIDREVYQPTLTQRYAIESQYFIAKNRDKPFFLYLASSFPHEPLYASAQFSGKSKYGLYGDCVEELDYHIGKIIATLEEFNLLENTIIIFSSDNGGRMVPQRFGKNERTGSNGQLKGYKTLTYEGGVRVPTIFYWKDKVKPGTTLSNVTSLMDWLPTLSTIVGTTQPANTIWDGINVFPFLTQNSAMAKKYPERTLFFSHKRNTEAVIQGKWKYKRVFEHSKKHPGYEDLSLKSPVLVDLESDPAEKENLIDKNQSKAAELEKLMQQFESQFPK